MSTTLVRIQLLSKTATDWATADPVLLEGEAGIANVGTLHPVLKIGDGVRPWSTLPDIVAAGSPQNILIEDAHVTGDWLFDAHQHFGYAPGDVPGIDTIQAKPDLYGLAPILSNWGYFASGVNGGPAIETLRVNGSYTAPTPVMAGQEMGYYSFYGLSAEGSPRLGAELMARAMENYTDAAHGSDVVLSICPVGANALTHTTRWAGERTETYVKYFAGYPANEVAAMLALLTQPPYYGLAQIITQWGYVATGVGGGPVLSLVRLNGSNLAPTPVLNGHSLGYVAFSGLQNAGAGALGADIVGRALENFTPTASGSEIIIECMPIGSNVIQAVARFSVAATNILSAALQVGGVAVPSVNSSPTWTGNHIFSPTAGIPIITNAAPGSISGLRVNNNGANDVEVLISTTVAGDAYLRTTNIGGQNWSVGNQRGTGNFVVSNAVGLGAPFFAISPTGRVENYGKEFIGYAQGDVAAVAAIVAGPYGGIPTAAVNAGFLFSRAGAGPRMSLLRVNGSYTAPTGVLFDEGLGTINFGGRDSAGNYRDTVQLFAHAMENFTAGGCGTELAIYVTSPATVALTRIALFSPGHVDFDQDIRSKGEGRFSGWYNTPSGDVLGPAVEVGYSSPAGYVMSYDRNAGVRKPLFLDGAYVTLAANGVSRVIVDPTTVQIAQGSGGNFIGFTMADVAAIQGNSGIFDFHWGQANINNVATVAQIGDYGAWLYLNRYDGTWAATTATPSGKAVGSIVMYGSKPANAGSIPAASIQVNSAETFTASSAFSKMYLCTAKTGSGGNLENTMILYSVSNTTQVDTSNSGFNFTKNAQFPYIWSDSMLSLDGSKGINFINNTATYILGSIFVSGGVNSFPGYVINDGATGTKPMFVSQLSNGNCGIYLQVQDKWLLVRTAPTTCESNFAMSAPSFTPTSSREVKRETGKPSRAAAMLAKLRPIFYRHKLLEEVEQMGLVAEEVAEVCPQLSDGKTIAYDRLAVLLLTDWQESRAILHEG